MICEGNVARMGRRLRHVGSWWESQRERDRKENLDVGGRILHGWILERYYGILGTGLIWLGKGISGRLLLTR
jgi:hypothetical protein